MTSFYAGKYVQLLVLSLLCPFFSVFAQKQYRLQDLTEAAARHLPVLQQKQFLVNSAKASVTDVRHSFLPQLRASEQLNLATDNSIAGSVFPFSPVPSSSGGVRVDNNGQLATGNIASLYGEYELVNFGLNHAKLATAQAFVNLQQSDLEREQYLVTLQVARLYFAILKTQYRLDTDRENVKRYDSIFSVIRALTLSGLRAGSDSSLAKAELSRTAVVYNQSLGNLLQLKQQLSYYTGVAPDQLQIDSLANRFLARTPIPLNNETDTLQNPLLNYYEQKRKVQESFSNLIRKTYQPRIVLGASTWARGSSIQFPDTYKSMTNGLGYQRFNYAVGVGLNYNLFSGMYKKDKLAINRFEVQASEQELAQQKQLLSLSRSQADNALHTAESNLNELPVQMRAAYDTYQQKLAQYRAGIISLIDLTNASFVLYRSQTDYIETLSDWYLAQLDKAAAAGTLTQFIQTIN